MNIRPSGKKQNIKYELKDGFNPIIYLILYILQQNFLELIVVILLS